MIHEYALEPELVATWGDRKDARYFIEQFGLGRPRVVSRYPRRWKSRVWDAFESDDDMERKRMTELIARLGEAMVRRPDARWNSDLAWIDNAEEEHGRVPFHAVLARENPHGAPHVLIADNLDDTSPLWGKSRRGMTVSRSAAEMAEAVAPMLRNARELVFVDPHFRPKNRRHREPLRAFLRAVIETRPGAPPRAHRRLLLRGWRRDRGLFPARV